jgi:hypothetical protein
MSSFLYNGNCYSSAVAAYAAMAAQCPPVTSSGQSLLCSSTSNGYTISVGGGNPVMVTPALESCNPEVTDASALAGLVVLALASVYAVKLLMRAI